MKIKFGTDGIRGPVESEITPEVCLKVGHAAGKVLKEEGWDTVLIGKDTRVSGYMLESALQAGFIASGVNVRLLGPLPTPGVAYLTKSLRGQFGVVISASHNDFHDNGIKIFSADGVKISREIEKKIEKVLATELMPVPTSKLGKALRFDESGDRYIEFCKSTVPSEVSFSSLRIVIDCANGACYKVTPSIFRELGAEVIEMATNPDGFNINKDCGAVYPKKMAHAVIDNNADIGIAFDGDADRLIVSDEKGNIIDGDQLLAVLAIKLQRDGELKKSTIVGTSMTNHAFDLWLNNIGINLMRTDVGDRYISEAIKQFDYSLGGEPSGHILIPHLSKTGDALMNALIILCEFVRENKLSSNFFKKHIIE